MSTYVINTLAGLAGSEGSADGAGSTARFDSPTGAAVDTAGNVYLADFYNSTIRKITPGGVVTTLAGLAGSYDSADGTGAAARFNHPYGVAVDSAGNFYVTDYGNSTIRKITSGGVVTTLAGSARNPGSADGTGSAARFYTPCGVAVDSAGYVYVADAQNATIRRITPGGVVTTLLGLAGSVGSAARSGFPTGVAVDSAGNVYVADSAYHTIRKITSSGVVMTLAGLPGASGSADGTGSAARFYSPGGVAVDSAGNVYVADTQNATIRKITAGGAVTTVAGLAGNQGSADGTGSAARFYGPNGVAVDGAGTLYVADSGNNTIRVGVPPRNYDATTPKSNTSLPAGIGPTPIKTTPHPTSREILDPHKVPPQIGPGPIEHNTGASSTYGTTVVSGNSQTRIDNSKAALNPQPIPPGHEIKGEDATRSRASKV